MSRIAWFKLMLTASTVLSLQAVGVEANSRDEIEANIDNIKRGNPLANQIKLAMASRQAKEFALKERVSKASEITLAIQDVELTRDARVEEVPLFTDYISSMDGQFNEIIGLAIACRNHLTSLPDDPTGKDELHVEPHLLDVTPYAYEYAYKDGAQQDKKIQRTKRNDARNLQLYTFTLAATLRKLKKSLNANPFDVDQIKQSHDAFLAIAVAMEDLVLRANERAKNNIQSKAVPELERKVAIVKDAMDAVARGESEIKKAKEDLATAQKFIGMFSQIGGLVGGLGATGDGFAGNVFGEVGREFGETITKLIGVPILADKERAIKDDLKIRFGDLGTFTSEDIKFAYKYSTLALQLFKDQWCDFWNDPSDQLVNQSKICRGALSKVVQGIVDRKVRLRTTDTTKASYLIEDSLLKVNRRLQYALSKLSTAKEIYDYNPSILVPSSISELLGSIDTLKNFQGLLNSFRANDEASVARITGYLKQQVWSQIRDAFKGIYLQTLKVFNDPTLGIHQLALQEIDAANDAILKAAIFVTGGVNTQKGLVMMMPTDTIDATIANDWATEMCKNITYGSIITAPELSVLVQSAYSIPLKLFSNREPYMIEAYPKYSNLGLDDRAVEELSVFLHGALDLLVDTPGYAATVLVGSTDFKVAEPIVLKPEDAKYLLSIPPKDKTKPIVLKQPQSMDDKNPLLVKPQTQTAVEQVTTYIDAEFDGLYKGLCKLYGISEPSGTSGEGTFAMSAGSNLPSTTYVPGSMQEKAHNFAEELVTVLNSITMVK